MIATDCILIVTIVYCTLRQFKWQILCCRYFITKDVLGEKIAHLLQDEIAKSSAVIDNVSMPPKVHTLNS